MTFTNPKLHGLFELHYPTILLRLGCCDGNDGDNEDALNGAEQLPRQGLLPTPADPHRPSRAALLRANETPPEVHPGQLPGRSDWAARLGEVAGEAAWRWGYRRRKRQERDQGRSRRSSGEAEIVFFHLGQERSVIVALP